MLVPVGSSTVFRDNKILGFAQRTLKGCALQFEFLFPDSEALSKSSAYLIKRMKDHNAYSDSMVLQNVRRDRGMSLLINVRDNERSAEFLKTVCIFLGSFVQRLRE
ncbi:MAG: hypothetical protein QW343_01180 [Candidatus Norongarragalinales archaeon]